MNIPAVALSLSALSLLAAACPARAAAPVPPWGDPAVNALNRLEARTFAPPSDDAVLSLDGVWDFKWCGTEADTWTGDWATIDVPSCVELRGWGHPHYTNTRYPHGKDLIPKIDPSYNPTMTYRRTFRTPPAWDGRRVTLRFEGVASCAEIQVNGAAVGYFEDARLPSEFDVTRVLKPAGADNELTVKVRKWCDGSYLEDQDMIRYAGIFRRVMLVAEPTDGIFDFVFTTEPDAAYRNWTCRLTGADRARLYAADGRLAGTFADGELTLASPRLWNHEDPYLYTLEMEKGTDVRRVKVGVRRVEIKDGLILVNGRPVKFKGVNRHEMNATNGYTLAYAEMVEDVRLMKQANFNCVRTSHYPADPRFYDLCDEYGLYVCAEANVESHGIGYGADCLPQRPEWTHTFVERNVRNVRTFRNHPCIAMWSYGNESGWGRALAAVREAIAALDPVTPYHGVGWRHLDHRNQCVWDDSDMTGGQYMALDKIRALANDPKPFWLMEYSCAMGNGMGNFKEYWDVFYESDKLSGGALWDWLDQAMVVETDRVAPDGTRDRFLGYGGDHDEQPNDGPYCANGILDARRQPSAKYWEVKHVQQPIEVACADAASGVADLWNRYEFSFADEQVTGEWSFWADGVCAARGALDVPHVAPRQKGALVLPAPGVALQPGQEGFYRVTFRTKRAADWADKGFEIAWNQLPYGVAPKPVRAGALDGGRIVETADGFTVTAGATKAVFSRRTGTLAELTMGGKTILRDAAGIVHGPRLQVERAFNDSDNWMRRDFLAKGMTHLTHHVRSLRADGARVVSSVRVTGAKSGGFDFTTVWTFGGDGAVNAEHTMTPFGDVPELPRVGTFQRLAPALTNLTWYGRGPWENMTDRKTACDIARWRSTVAEQYVDYIRPQDNGGKCDVRWADFTDPADGRGVRVACDAPYFLQALHFTHDDLDQARHRPGEPRRRHGPVPRPEVCLSVDVRQTGLGCNNCGPRPLPPYHFPVEKTVWNVRYTPVAPE